MRRVMLVLLMAACGGDDGPIGLAFTSPSAGDSFTRDRLGATGALAAMVPIELAVTGAPTRIALAAGPRALPDLELGGAGTAEVRSAGAVTLTAIAFDGDVAVATATVEIAVADPGVASCQDWLALYGVDFTVGPAQPGVTDPVTAKMPINGVPYKAVGATNPRAQLFGDCTIIKSLAEAAPAFRERAIALVTDYGVYNYRCIGGGTPPDCPNGISQHAYATAIDLAGFTTSDDTFFSVNDDWVIDPDAEDTCAAPTEPGKDQFLHELICELKTAGVWNIVLTPNYNADHRNHFHVDLTPDSDFIERRTSPPDNH